MQHSEGGLIFELIKFLIKIEIFKSELPTLEKIFSILLSCSFLCFIPMCVCISLHCPASCCHLGEGIEKAKFVAYIWRNLEAAHQILLLAPAACLRLGPPCRYCRLCWHTEIKKGLTLCPQEPRHSSDSNREVFEVRRNLHSFRCNNLISGVM